MWIVGSRNPGIQTHLLARKRPISCAMPMYQCSVLMMADVALTSLQKSRERV